MSKKFTGVKKYLVYCSTYYEGYLYNTNEIGGRVYEHYKTRAGDLHVEIDNKQFPLNVFYTEKEVCCFLGIQLANNRKRKYNRTPYPRLKLLRIARKYYPEEFV